jgi:predicted nucleic acid-binding Zn ribbon protein
VSTGASGEAADEEFEDVPRGKRPRRLGDLVGRFVQRTVGADAPAARDIFTHWAEIVGEHVAPHVTPVRLEKRVLTVEVVENAWATQMTFLEPQLLTTLREHAGDVVDSITVRVRRSR